MKIFLLSFLLFFSLNADDKLNANFSNLSIVEFIQLVSTVTNKNILNNYDLEGYIDLSNGSSIPESDFLNILSSVLKSKGYLLSDKGSFLEIVKSDKSSFLTSKQTTSSTFIKINNYDVDKISEKIKPLISENSALITFKKSNMIFITDYPQNVEIIKSVINKIDLKNNFVVKLVSVRNVDLKSIVSYLTDISSVLFDDEILQDKVKIISHDSLNSIILVGNELNIDKLITYISSFDNVLNIDETTQIFNLKNSNAKDVLKSLLDILEDKKNLDLPPKYKISISEDINSIIVITNPLLLKSISSLISELDKEKFQVYVEARIFEINEDSSKALGIKWGFDGSKLFSNGGLLSFSSSFGGLDVSQNFSSTISSTFVGNGFALGASLDFLQTNGASKSISNPSILCVNNKESFIYVGKTISVSTGSSSSAVSGVTNSFARENVGLTLKITPRVSSDEKVTLDISAVIANLLDDGSNNATHQPVTSKQEVNTQAILRHGEHIIIGGLVKSYNVDFINRVPFLSNIPYFGDALFTSRSSTTQRDNLVVILTPYIIDKSEKLSKLQDDLGILSKMQEKYNIQIFNHIRQNGLKVD
jgi:general secretion pathway protein D